MLLKNFGIEDLDGGWIFNGSFSYTLSTIIIGQIRGLQICRLLYVHSIYLHYNNKYYWWIVCIITDTSYNNILCVAQ